MVVALPEKGCLRFALHPRGTVPARGKTLPHAESVSAQLESLRTSSDGALNMSCIVGQERVWPRRRNAIPSWLASSRSSWIYRQGAVRNGTYEFTEVSMSASGLPISVTATTSSTKKAAIMSL
jgi:hypothetical protein